MIAGTLKEIAKIYKPGMVSAVKRYHSRSWVYITGIESKIDAFALSGDFHGLIRELRRYFSAWKSVLNDRHSPSGEHNGLSRESASLP